MATVELTSENFEDTATKGIVLVDFWASWCGPCRVFGPIFERVSDKHDDVVFAKVNTEIEESLAAQFDIRSIPTVMAIRDGVIVYSQPGALPEQALELLIEKVQELDMEEVKAKAA